MIIIIIIIRIHNIIHISPDRDCRNIVWFDRFDQAAVGKGGAYRV